MKQDVINAATNTAVVASGIAATWTLQEISLLMSIFVGGITCLWICIQIVFLLRKWHLLEKNKWQPIPVTTPGEFDGQSRKNC